jgi:hypothetical protein
VSIDWAAQPIQANQTALLLGGPFVASSKITLYVNTSNGAIQELTVPPHQPTAGSIKFVVPEGLKLAQWQVSVDHSDAYTLNGPQPWWAMGDKRQHATPGGYIRVFGSCVRVASEGEKAAKQELGAAKQELTKLLDSDADVATDFMPLVQRVKAARKSFLAASTASASALRLTATSASTVGATPIVLQSDTLNSTAWSAWFTLPSSIAPGEYTIEVSNHLVPGNFVTLGRFGSYISPDAPQVSTITVLSAEEVAQQQPWKATSAKVFKVTDYGPSGLPGCGPRWSKVECPVDPATGKQWAPQNYWANASVAIEKALAAAGAAGGGTVYFPRGTYFVNSSYGFEVPWGVKLQGEGRELVEIIFSETYGVSVSV